MSLSDFVEWERKLAVRRSVVLFATLWMTWRSSLFLYEFATLVLANKGDMLGAAALAAAIGTPIATLQGYVFKAYIGSKDTP